MAHRTRFPLVRRHRTRRYAGKTTTLRVLLGLVQASAGEALIGAFLTLTA